MYKNTTGTSKLNPKHMNNTKPQLFVVKGGKNVTAVRKPYVF